MDSQATTAQKTTAQKARRSLLAIIVLFCVMTALILGSGGKSGPLGFFIDPQTNNDWLLIIVSAIGVIGLMAFWIAKIAGTKVIQMEVERDYKEKTQQQAQSQQFDDTHKTYCKILKQRTEKLTIPGLPDNSIEVKTLNTFVDMAFRKVAQQDNELKMLAHEKERQPSSLKTVIEEWITEQKTSVNENKTAPVLMITGDAGCGKSSLIKYLCQYFIDEKPPEDYDYLQITESYHPLYLPLYVMNLELTDNDKRDDSIIKRLAVFYRQATQQQISEEYFQQCLNEKNILLLLDGFDEINQEKIIPVCGLINLYREAHSQHLIVITSRRPAYLNNAERLPAYRQVAEVLPITDLAKQQAIVAKTFANIPLNKNENPETLGEQFKGALDGDENKALQKLGDTPFILQAMAVLWYSDSKRELPGDKAKLYYKLFKQLFFHEDTLQKKPLIAGQNDVGWIDKFNLMDHFHILGEVALTVAQKDDLVINDTDLVRICQVQIKNHISSDDNLQEKTDHYIEFLTNRVQIMACPPGCEYLGSEFNYHFNHKTLMEYLAAWRLRHRDEPQTLSATSSIEAMLKKVFSLAAHYSVSGFDVELANSWYEVLPFFVQIPNEHVVDLTDRSAKGRERYKQVVPVRQVLAYLLKAGFENNQQFRLSDNKNFEFFYYQLFRQSPLLSVDIILSNAKDKIADIKGLLQKHADPEEGYLLLNIVQSILYNQQLSEDILAQIKKQTAQLLSSYLIQWEQAEGFPDMNQPPPQERKAYMQHLLVHKAEALIRVCDREKLPVWRASEVYSLSEDHWFSGSYQRLINPDEQDAEYIGIVPGDFADNSDGGGLVDGGGLGAYKKAEDTYFMARYPVTFGRYRFFIAYLKNTDHSLRKILPFEAFETKLRELAALRDQVYGERGCAFVAHLDQAGSLAASLQSAADSYEGFNHDDQPVCGVNWYDACSYCFWLSCLYFVQRWSDNDFQLVTVENTRLNRFRLPEEAEFYWAAVRITEEKHYCWDGREGVLVDNDMNSGQRFEQLCNYNKNIGKTNMAGVYPLGGSSDGLQDIAGNVWEWQENWVYSKQLEEYLKKEGMKPDTGHGPALRGGSWSDRAEYLPCSVRVNDVPWNRDDHMGFRVVCARSRFEKATQEKD